MYYVYIVSNYTNSVIYIGVTNDLHRRLYEHREGLNDGFTKRYRVYKLVYFETTENVNAAIAREKQLKGWTREKKFKLIAEKNPLFEEISFWNS